MDRKSLVVSASLAIVAAGAAWWIARPGDEPAVAPDTRAATPDARGERVEADAPATSPMPDAAMPPAPPAVADESAPSATPATAGATPIAPTLRDEIADLDRRARAGEVGAACRLGAELLRCERARVMQPYTDNLEAQARALAQRGMATADIDRQIDAALQRQAENAAALAHCEGVDETQWPVPARYFNLAAQAGHRPSMVQFLNAERFRADQLFRDPGLIPLFRANAPRYFLQLMQEGNLEMLQRWGMSAGLPHDVLRDVLPPPYNEPGFAAAMQQQALRARGIEPPRNLPQRDPPTPEQIAEAERLYAELFAPRHADEDDLRRRLTASPYDLEGFRCDEAPRAAP